MSLSATADRRLRRLVEEAVLARRKIIVTYDGVASGKKPVDQTAADEAGGTGDEISHTLALVLR
jgi:hypothetical protein